MICPACALRDAEDGDVCRECAGQITLLEVTTKPCVACGCVKRTKYNQCVRCQRRRAIRRYRKAHGIPLHTPVMSRSEAGRLGGLRTRRTA